MTTRGRPRALTPEIIGEAVAEVGFQNLTFTAVSSHLGVGQSTLFRYVHTRDELVKLGMEAIAEKLSWPEFTNDWEETLRQQAMFAWTAWGEYPGVAQEASRGVYPTAMLIKTVQLVDHLISHGFSADDAVLAVDSVFDLVMDNRRGLESFDAPTDSGLTAREEFASQLSPLMPAIPHPSLESLLEVINVDPLTWITKKLDLMLAGIRTTLTSPPNPQS